MFLAFKISSLLDEDTKKINGTVLVGAENVQSRVFPVLGFGLDVGSIVDEETSDRSQISTLRFVGAESMKSVLSLFVLVVRINSSSHKINLIKNILLG